MIERFGEQQVLSLKTDGFHALSLNNKKLVFHLSEAGLYGRDIFYAQGSEHNLPLRNCLENIYNVLKNRKLTSEIKTSYDKLESYLKTFWFHVGIYHSHSNKRLDVCFNEKDFDTLVIEAGVEENEQLKYIKQVLFNPEFTKKYKNIQQEGIDVVAESGGGFYKGLTSFEVDEYREKNYPKVKNSPQFGFNSLLEKNKNGEIKEKVIYLEGEFSEQIEKIVHHLNAALEFAENDIQRQSIKSLITFYQTGKPEDFDQHSLDWVKDQESEVFFINGLIESYDDPKGVACTFESVVAFKNPEQTKKVNKIIENIQWFEDNLPISKEFKKKKASGLSASSVTVASMAGATSPVLPLGICLPNSDWIRADYGSKSVNLHNVHSSREKGESKLREEFYLKEYHEILDKHSSESSSLHTDLHEVTGHGSGRSLSGVSNEALDIYYSVIEESRADLVGLYFIFSEKLKEFGIVDKDVDIKDFALSQYVTYLTNGALVQLRRTELGANLAQPHMRNRQLVSRWVLEKSFEDKAVEEVVVDGKRYIKVNDLNKCNHLFGELLKEIQRIKSEGDFDAARLIVEKYGTKVDYNTHKEIMGRVKEIDLPNQTGFVTPIYVPVMENGEIIDFEIKEKESFAEDQLYLSEKYSIK